MAQGTGRRTHDPRCATPSRSRSHPPERRLAPRGLRPPHRVGALEIKQAALAIEPAPVTGEITIAADEPMAGDDDRDRILSVRGTDCPGRARMPDPGSELRVAPGPPIW